jgi:hypothetical protein
MAAQALNGLGEDVEIGGILWGKPIDSDSILILDATLVSAASPRFNSNALDVRGIVQSLGGPAPKPELAPAGYFRSHLREGLFLSPQDRALIDEHFRAPESVLLVIKPFQAGVCTAGFFFWHNERIADESDLDVPFVPGANTDATSSHGRPDPHANEASIVDILRESAMRHTGPHRSFAKPLPDNSPPAATNEPRKQSPWRLLITAALLGILIVMAGAAIYLKWPMLRALVQSAPKEPAKVGIDLTVVRTPEGPFSVSWNQDAPEVVNAQDGTLVIVDGRSKHKLLLDNPQLRSGNLLYTSKTGSVQFKLELNLGNQHTVESVIRVASQSAKGSEREQHFPVSRSVVVVPIPETLPVVTPSGSAGAVPPPAPVPVSELHGVSHASPSEPAGAYVPPRVVQEMMPQTAPVGHFAQIAVDVTIDPNGQVTTARPADKALSAADPLTAITLAAARQWRFLPATMNGKPITAEYRIVFAFRPPVP